MNSWLQQNSNKNFLREPTIISQLRRGKLIYVLKNSWSLMIFDIAMLMEKTVISEGIIRAIWS